MKLFFYFPWTHTLPESLADIPTPAFKISDIGRLDSFVETSKSSGHKGGMIVKQPEIVLDCTYSSPNRTTEFMEKGRNAVNYLQTDGKSYRELYTMKYNEMDLIQQVTVSRVM